MGLYALTVVCALASFAGTQVAEKRRRNSRCVTKDFRGLTCHLRHRSDRWVVVDICTGTDRNGCTRKSGKIPRLGPTFKKLTFAIYTYRSQPLLLIGLVAMSTAVHCLFALSVFVMAMGLGIVHPTFIQHLVISPMSNLAASVPLPGGIGAFETMFSKMYVEGGFDAGTGLAVALGFRLVTIINALIGVMYYLNSKKDVDI